MIYRFADCEVDTKLLELRRNGTVHAMDPLGFDLLVYLVEHRDRVLSRNELLDALWPGKVVTDSALSSRLKAVRAAVGDTGAAQAVVRTVHGRGYRFVAPVTEAAHEDAPSRVHADVNGADPTGAADSRTQAIGRETELETLRRRLLQADSGRRQIVWVCGEAGVGKTTLVRAFLESAVAGSAPLVLHGQCVNQRGASEAYLPLLDALGRAGLADAAITGLLRRHAPAWLAQLPALCDPGGGDALPVGVTAVRMLREISSLFDALASDRTVVLVLEDLHWSDPSTLEWLDYYARRDAGARLLLIGTGRPEGDAQRVASELATRAHADALYVGAIDATDIDAYLDFLLGKPPTRDLAALTYRRSDGFPLFIDALVAHWQAGGMLREIDGQIGPAVDEASLTDGVPGTLAQLIDRQLAGLDDTERRLLETAALAGSPFAATVVAHALDASNEAIEGTLGRLARRRRVVRDAGESRWPDGTVTAMFEFRHELYRETLSEQVPAARRSRLHGAIGDRLEQGFGNEPGAAAGEIADHFARAHDVVRALRHFHTAARSALNRSASREAVAILDRALGLVASLSETDETRQLERELQLLRASAMITLEGWASTNVEASYARAHELGLKLGLGDQAPEIYGIAAMHELRGRFTKSQALIEGLVGRDTQLGLEAYELLACSLFHQGRFAESREQADKAIEAYDPHEISSILARYGENPGVCCHGWAALDLWFLGFPAAALERSDRALELAAAHVYSLSTALTHRTFLHQFRHEPIEALDWAEKTRDVAAKQGFGFRDAQTAIIGAWARGITTDDDAVRDQALAAIDRSLAQHAAMGAEMDKPYYLALKADVLRIAGRLSEAIATLDEAFASLRASRVFFYEAEMERVYALLIAARDGDAANGEAEKRLERSLALARRQGARMLQLRTARTRLGFDGDDRARTPRLAELEALMADLPEARNTPDWAAARAVANG